MKVKIIALLAVLFSAGAVHASSMLEDRGIDSRKSLEGVVRGVSDAIGDGNITTGTNLLGYVKMPNEIENLPADNLAKFRRMFARHVGAKLPDDAKIITIVGSYPDLMYQMVYDLGIANAATMDHCARNTIKRKIRTKACDNLHDFLEMFELIGAKMAKSKSDIVVVRSATKVLNDDDQELREVTYSALYNKKTGAYVWLFTIEGTM